MARKRSNSAQALQNELVNFSNFQNNQLNALTSISGALEATNTSIVSVQDSLLSITESMNSLSKFYDAERIERERHREETRKHTKSIFETNKALLVMKNHLQDLGKELAHAANTYSKISNDLISTSGASGSEVRATREYIVQDIVSQINKETGGYLNPEKSYQKMVDAINAANVGNLESMKEMARPLLLASESMNVNTGELATVLNRWYTRYNFSSREMEDMVDEIRGNTAGNNASVEAAMKNMEKFETLVGLSTNGDKDRFSDIMSAISQETSRYQAAGIDSGPLFDWMNQIISGNPDSQLLQLLGGKGDWTDLYDKLRNGSGEDYKEVLNLIYQGALEKQSEIWNAGGVAGLASKNYGFDQNYLNSLAAANNALLSPEEFEKEQRDAQKSAEAIGDKHLSLMESIENKLSFVSEGLSKIQETVGISFTDLITIGSQILLISSLRSSLKGVNIGSSLGAGTLGSAGSRLMNSNFVANQWVNTTLAGEKIGLSGSAATAAGTGITMAGIGAGAALTVDGIRGLFKEGEDAGYKSLSAIEAAGGAGSIAGLVALGATNPVGWVALAIGGIGFLGKKAYENAHELTGNAKDVAKEIDQLNTSLEDENKSRLEKISELNYQFSQATELSEKENLMKESGLFELEDIQGKNATELQNLIDSYKEASLAMDRVTEGVLGIAETYEKDRQGAQQKDFVNDLQFISDEGDLRYQALQLLKSGVSDEKTLAKIDKAIESAKKNTDFYVSEQDWNDIMYGGKNSWFDSNNITDQSVDIRTMNLIAGLTGSGKSYTSSEDTMKAAELYANLKSAMNKSEFEAAKKAIDESKLEYLIDDLYGAGAVELLRKANGYKVGSNYISSDQLANLHEGEAVVPKKYNPSANVTELEMLRKYYKDNSSRESSEMNNYVKELVSTLTEMREFLSEWKEDNNRRDISNQRLSRFNYQSKMVSGFLATD